MPYLFKEPVLKAKRVSWKRTRTFARQTALSKQMASMVRVDLKDGLTKFKKRVPLESVYQSWISGDYQKLITTIPFEELPGFLGKAKARIGDTVGASAKKAIAVLPPPIRNNLRYDVTNPSIKRYIENQTGQLIVKIGEETKGVVRSMVQRSFTQALTPDRAAKLIRNSIGLYPQQETALWNYRAGLEKSKDFTPARVEQLTSAYEERLLDYRCMMIARTEIQGATNQGQLDVWQSAAEQDLIDRETATKEIELDGNPCPDCEELEAEGPIGLYEEWSTDDGSYDSPPFHPNCMCEMTLNFE